MKKRDISLALILSSAVFSSQLCHANGQADKLVVNSSLLNLSLSELGEITIATRTSRSNSEIPSTVYVYSQEDIRRHGWTSLAELVPNIPGVDVINKGGRGLTMSVRGVGDLSFHGNKSVVLIDGHNAGYSATGSPGFSGIMDQYDILNAKRVEVQIGPGGTLHGANAFGIVINIITLDAGDINGVEADVIVGSQGKIIPSIRYGKRSGSWGMFQSFTGWKQNDAELSEVAISRNPDGSVVEYDNDTFEAQTAANFDLHGYVEYDDSLRIGYRYSRIESGRGTSLLSTQKGNLKIDQPMIYLDYKTGITDRLSYNLISHYKKTKADENENYFVDTVRNLVGVSLSESDSLVVDNQFTFFQSNVLTWVSGLYLERSRQRPSAVNVVPGTIDPDDRVQPTLNPEEDYDNFAGYLQLEWIPDNRFYLVSGLRDVSTDSKYSSEIIPRLGMRYVMTDEWLVKFNYQQGYRPPSVGEGRGRGVVAPNPDLSSEIIDSIELSIVGEPVSGLGLRLTYYDSKVSDLIARTSYTGSGGFVSIDDNVGQVNINGVEIEANYRLNEKLEIESTVSYTDSVNKMTNENTRTVIPYKLNLSFIYQPAPQWSLVWDNYYRWNPTTDSENALYDGEDAPSWLLSNLTITNDRIFDIKNLKLSLSVRNIFNEEYGLIDPRSTTRSVNGNPLPPFLTSYHPQESINFLVGINYRFD